MLRTIKFYIAGRTKDSKQIKELAIKLEELGYRNSFNWTVEPSYKPYSHNYRLASLFAQKTLRHIKDADYLVLIWDSTLYGALIEFGFFLAQNSATKRLYILGSKRRICIFEILPRIEATKTEKELLTKIAKDFPVN